MAKALSLADIVPDPTVLLALPPEELGFVILRVLASVTPDDPGRLNRSNFFGAPSAAAVYPPQHRAAVRDVLPEGWAWLEREGLIVPNPDQRGEWVMLSRRGRELATQPDLLAYRQAHLLPRASLHPALLDAGVDANFVRGLFDAAVLLSFRALEIRVRAAAKLGPEDHGTDLMRKAFHAESGPLRLPPEVPKAERDSLGHVMAGAIGLYRNASGHRDAAFADAAEAAEIILFASHLLRTVDRLAARVG